MPEDEFYTSTDIDMLRMENELLSFEIRFLRSRLDSTQKGPASSVSLNRMAYLEEAERDLVLLIRRMATSPAGPFLRFLGTFRSLQQRYLRSSAAWDATRPENRVARLEEAERDLVLLLSRMASSPLAPLLRRKAEFRTLEQRYL